MLSVLAEGFFVDALYYAKKVPFSSFLIITDLGKYFFVCQLLRSYKFLNLTYDDYID